MKNGTQYAYACPIDKIEVFLLSERGEFCQFFCLPLKVISRLKSFKIHMTQKTYFLKIFSILLKVGTKSLH